MSDNYDIAMLAPIQGEENKNQINLEDIVKCYSFSNEHRLVMTVKFKGAKFYK